LWFHGILARDANHTYLRNTRVFLNTHVTGLTHWRQPRLGAVVGVRRFEGRHRSRRVARCLTCQQAAYVDARASSRDLAGSPSRSLVRVPVTDQWSGSDLGAMEELCSTCPPHVSKVLTTHWSYWYWYNTHMAQFMNNDEPIVSLFDVALHRTSGAEIPGISSVKRAADPTRGQLTYGRALTYDTAVSACTVYGIPVVLYTILY